MVVLGTEFRRVADVVAERAAELLQTVVYVLDEAGALVASHAAGPSTLTPRALPAAAYARGRLTVEERFGEVIAAEPLGPDGVPSRIAQAILELTISQAAVVDRLPNQRELKNRFIRDLLRGPLGDESSILREARLLGLDFSRPRAVVLIDAAAFILEGDGLVQLGRRGGQVHRSYVRTRAIIASIVDFFDLPNETICAYIGDGEVAILKAITSQDLAAWTSHADEADGNGSWANLAALKRAGRALLTRLREETGTSISLGIGRYHRGMGGLARSYQDARAALSLGRRLGGHPGVLCLDGLGVAAFVGVADERTKIDLARHLLSPLDHEPELLETLAAFFANNCAPIATARALNVHRNTLGYRLDKVTALAGLDPREFDAAVQIRLALVLRELDRADAPPTSPTSGLLDLADADTALLRHAS